MTKRFFMFAAAFLAFPSAASAQDQDGTWAMKINDAAIWVFDIERDDDGDWSGSWLRPARFEGNGMVFVRFLGEERVETQDGMERDGVVQLRFMPTRQGGTPDVLHFAMTGENEMTMEYLGTDLAPYPLVRVVRSTGLGPFEEGMIYDRDNAQTVSDYDPAEEPAEDEVAEIEAPDVSDDQAAAPDQTAVAAAADELGEAATDETPRMDGNFLDGLGEASAPDTTEDDVVTGEADAELVRACSDLDRRNLPEPAALDTLWGSDYAQIGNGLDIREYAMTNGDVARVTVLDDRIYLNNCGPA